MKNFILFLLLSGFLSSNTQSQVYERPNFALSSHPTLEVSSIEKWSDQTVVNISIRNESISGSFCIDQETYLVNSLGTDEYRLTGMEGIPACPEVYKFKSIGEVHKFSLLFPLLPDNVKYLDLSERCGEACVDLKYILLDEELNERISKGFDLYEIGRLKASLQVFEDIMADSFDNLSPVYGTIYLYLMSIHYELGSSKDLRRVYNELRESSVLGREEFIESARETGLVR
jgi:hypothetical protein